MKRILAVSLAVVLTAYLGALLAAEGKQETWHGFVTDDMCGKKHMEATPEHAKQCAIDCAAKGAKLALYVPGTDKLYVLSDQAKAKEFAGEHVVVKGTVSADGKSITVAEIQKAEGKKKEAK